MTVPVATKKTKPIKAPNRLTVAEHEHRLPTTLTPQAHAVTILAVGTPSEPRTRQTPLKFMPSMEFTPTTSRTVYAGTTVGTLMQ